MPEGDSIHRAARRVGAALVGSEIRSIEMPQPRHSRDRWAERLSGRDVQSVDAHGKHLFLRFDGDLTLHSHLRMGGAWGVYARGARWHRAGPPRVARDPDRRPRRRAVRRPRARADDRGPHALRPAPRGARPGRAGAGVRRARRSSAACARRPEPAGRRGAARPADRVRPRHRLEVGGLLPGGHQPVAAARRPCPTTRRCASSTRCVR